jgi:hypothetical protein
MFCLVLQKSLSPAAFLKFFHLLPALTMHCCLENFINSVNCNIGGLYNFLVLPAIFDGLVMVV